MLNFDFLEKSLGIVFPPLCQEKCLSCYILLTDQILLPLLMEILDNICITIVSFPGCDVILFEINLIILIKSFFYMTEKSRQKLKYFENEKGF